jgi:RNA polymerase sigma factor (sigma-70 family)
MNPLTEQELIKQFINGDPKALEILIYQHKAKIFTSIYLLVKDKDLAEDIFQDTFIKVIDKLKSENYTNEGKFAAWVIRIAHNLCIDHFRKAKSRTFVKNTDDRDAFDRIGFAAELNDHNIEWRQSCANMRKMLDKLPAEQREVIILRHYADLSFAEIAGLTKCSINTALGRMRYGLINLRKMTKEKQIVF